MKKIVVFGAGLVSKPLVNYLLNVEDFHVTLGDMDETRAKHIIADAPNGEAVRINADDDAGLEALVKAHDLAVSLLPFVYHPKIADLCIRNKKHMVTASYVSDQMRRMDPAARDAGVTVLNEVGLDPGIDHMSAMRIIDHVHKQGGKIDAFRSYCGGLPAPADNDNPFGYKFSWSPRGVLKAGTNDARFLKDGQIVEILGKDLFKNHETLTLEGFAPFEIYPNRNSVPYIDTYGIPETKTMIRGTIRNTGWCDKLLALAKLGLVQETNVDLPEKATFADLMRKVTGAAATEDPARKAAQILEQAVDSETMSGLKWLGIFEDKELPASRNILDIMTDIFLEKMPFAPGEQDLIILYHEFEAHFPEGKKRITSTLTQYGIKDKDSGMARTVGLPCAIGVEMILKKKIDLTGVQIPDTPVIYQPILNRLEELGICCVETETAC